MATMRGGAISMRAERGGRGIGKGSGDQPKKIDFRKLWPTIWTLIKPRRLLIAFGFVLVVIKTVAGLTLPYLSKYLLDNVLASKNPQPELLPGLIGIVITATIIQAISSYSLTQLLSKEGQKLISDLRKQVQQHVGKLSVSYYDANRTGTLVSRIMTDVEGVRNLIGTGLIEFVGGMLTAILAFLYLMSRSVVVTLTVFTVIGAFVVILQSAFKKIRPIFRERAKINAEVTGRLTESLGGVRVIKGYHAEDREASVFSLGVDRLLVNVISSLKMTSTLGAASMTVLGLVSGLVMWLGGHAVLAHTWTVGDYFSYNMFLAFMVAPVFQIVNIGTSLLKPSPASTGRLKSSPKWKRTPTPNALESCRRSRAGSSSSRSNSRMKRASRSCMASISSPSQEP